MRKLLALLALLAVAAVLVAYLSAARWKDERAHAAEIKAKDAVIAAKSKELGGVAAVRTTDLEIRRSLEGKLAEYADKLKAAGGKLIEHASERITISDTTTGRFSLAPQGPTAPHDVLASGVPAVQSGPCGAWDDEYHRFHLDLCSGLLKRAQLFKYEAAVVKGLDGKHRFVKSELREFDPVTGAEIPNTGIAMEGEYQFGEESAPPVGWLHLRAVAAVDHRAALGGGLQFANWKDKANASILGLYSPRDRDVTVALHGGYRVRWPWLDTNLSVGPFVGFSIPRGWIGGAAVTLELTR